MAKYVDVITRVLSALGRRVFRPRKLAVRADGFPVFEVGPDAQPLTAEMVRDALEGS